MSMTNAEIINTNKKLNGIVEDVHTYTEWKRQGFVVKHGCKALFKTQIWKPVRIKNNHNDEYVEKLLLVKASFFGKSQVEKLLKKVV